MTRAVSAGALVAVLLSIVVPLGAQQRFPFEPFDEAASAPALLAVRSALVDAIMRHDVPGVARLLAPEFEPKDALAAFEKWPEFFRDLVTTLAFGGGFVNAEKTRFCAPFWYARPVQAAPYPRDLAPFEGYPFMVMLPNVPVFEKDDRQSKILGYMGLELVRLADSGPPPNISPAEALRREEEARRKENKTPAPMAEIMFQGKKAYIDSHVLRNPDETFEYACFEQRNGNWLLTAFGLH